MSVEKWDSGRTGSEYGERRIVKIVSIIIIIIIVAITTTIQERQSIRSSSTLAGVSMCRWDGEINT